MLILSTLYHDLSLENDFTKLLLLLNSYLWNIKGKLLFLKTTSPIKSGCKQIIKYTRWQFENAYDKYIFSTAVIKLNVTLQFSVLDKIFNIFNNGDKFGIKCIGFQ